MRRFAILLLLTACATVPATPPPSTPPPPDPLAKLQRIDGFIPLYWDGENGKLLMEVARAGEEMIYQTSLPAGVGSNPIGLDRGELGATHLVRFDRVGPRILLVELNSKYRAITNDPAERRAVEDSFATSILASFKVETTYGNRVIVDATDFFLSDRHGVAKRLRDTEQGTYTLDRNRSAIHLPRTKAFPRNTEVEAILTFATEGAPGSLVASVSPVPEIVSVREHHSFVALPEPGYTPRRFDPRVGFIAMEVYDYASPFTGPLEKRWILRHRLDATHPIIYYIDNGAPEPIRGALIEGASWWTAAFEAAGFHNAFKGEVLPADADPMDVRYNIVNWVHRSTRGWSYGESVVDPRTGEIIKGNVRLGSLRIRQDHMIASGLIPQFDELHDEALSQLDPKTSPSMLALARIRQLAAHEVGHTLGLDHNMAASADGRASVMDYPAPLVNIIDGKLDLSNAYATGIGAYDKWAIRYGYAQFAPGDEEKALNAIAREGMLFVKDADARPVSAAHPLGSVWDNGADPVATLKHEIEVRHIALDQFGLRNLNVGEPLSSLEEKLLPLYLHHRYQLEAALKSIGGLSYTYAVKEDGAIVPREVRSIVPPAKQREALALVLSTIDPEFLAIPQRVIDLIPPRAFGYEAGIAELFPKRTTPAFDPIAAATVAADMTISGLLDPNRAARLVQFHAENVQNPSLTGVIESAIVASMTSGSGYRAEIARATRSLLATRLMDLAANANADPQVRAEATEALRRFRTRLTDVADLSEVAHRRALREEIDRFLERPAEPRKPAPPPPIPAGPPI